MKKYLTLLALSLICAQAQTLYTVQSPHPLVISTNKPPEEIVRMASTVAAHNLSNDLKRLFTLADEIAQWADPDPERLIAGVPWTTGFTTGYIVTTPKTKAQEIRDAADALKFQAKQKEVEADQIEAKKKKVEEFKALVVKLKTIFGDSK